MKKYLNPLSIIIIFAFTGFGLYLNIRQQQSIDRSRLPQKVEQDRMFQRWITNLKNKGLEIEADEFLLKEENEIYNTTWMTVKSIDDPDEKIIFEETIEAHKNMDKVVFSPNERFFVDYRNTDRGSILSNQIRLYGLKEDKIIDARVLDCSVRANCYFDRAYFLDNDVFVITEFSRNIGKKDETASECSIEEMCTYTVKLHLIDMIHNKRSVYTSESFEIVLKEWIDNF